MVDITANLHDWILNNEGLEFDGLENETLDTGEAQFGV